MTIVNGELVERRVSSSESESETSDVEDDLLVNLNPSMKFKSRDIVPGANLSHIEIVLLHTRIYVREENVQVESLNFTQIMGCVRREWERSFPGKSLKAASRLAANIFNKAKRDFEQGRRILPKVMRVQTDRNKRMEETMSIILRLCSTAPPSSCKNRNRGQSRRAVGRQL